MTSLPLLSHSARDSIIAWCAEGTVTLHQFLAEVHQLAARFPAGSHLLNICCDRYHFSVGLAAAILTNKISLLPSTHTPEIVRQIKDFAPDVFCLTDNEACTVDLPQMRYPDMAVSPTDTYAIPQIDSKQCIAIVFTSGSTGTPQPHPKIWGALVSSVQAEVLRLGLLPNSHSTIIGTVPPQHMYGFESTVLMAWLSGNALSHAQPFYPADIGQTLSAIAAPRVLVSSPFHLRALLDAGLVLPEIAQVVCATAPLSKPLAHAIEARCHAPLMEIYGSTETGLIATRHPTQTAEWQLLPGVELIKDDNGVRAYGAHIMGSIAMGDIIEPISEEHFLLHGRIADMVNIAGKRHSLASLNHLLNSIPGVVDGAFYMPKESEEDRITRMAAFVVAPGMEASYLLAALREHIDPVFLPRPLQFVDALPRNHTGKLPQSALQALMQAQKLA